MRLKSRTDPAGELMYEVDSLYVSTEMILAGHYRKFPLDGFLLEACLLHFRVVWDFFYRAKKEKTDVVVKDFIPGWTADDPPARLKAIRTWLNAMLAHLTTHRREPSYKIGEITIADIKLIREHTKTLFGAFVQAVTGDQRAALKNPLAHKFTGYETLAR